MKPILDPLRDDMEIRILHGSVNTGLKSISLQYKRDNEWWIVRAASGWVRAE